jgi:Tir chaperone family protein CesT
MVTKDDIEGFLNRLNADGASHNELEPGLWVVKPGGALDFDVIVNFTPPVVIFRVKVMTLPSNADSRAVLNHRLLELNASELVHGAYGIEGDSIVMTEALELEHLDYEEFLAAYESITVALASHLREIGTFREAR